MIRLSRKGFGPAMRCDDLHSGLNGGQKQRRVRHRFIKTRQRMLSSGMRQQRHPVMRQAFINRATPCIRWIKSLDNRQPLHQYRPGSNAPLQFFHRIQPIRMHRTSKQDLPMLARHFNDIVVGDVQMRVARIHPAGIVVNRVKRQYHSRIKRRGRCYR